MMDRRDGAMRGDSVLNFWPDHSPSFSLFLASLLAWLAPLNFKADARGSCGLASINGIDKPLDLLDSARAARCVEFQATLAGMFYLKIISIAR